MTSSIFAPAPRRSLPARLAILAGVTISFAPAALAQWPQWGGPDRNFTVQAEGLADTWPQEGPPKLWYRELGDGYSTIIMDDGLLYTMYRIDEDEFSVALDAATGRTVWEHKIPSPFTETMSQNGPGPHSTPIVVGDRVFTVGTNAVLHCFDKKTGKVLWKRDLVAEFGAPLLGYGYGSSPIAYGDTIILVVGRDHPEQTNADPAGEPVKDEAEVRNKDQTLVAYDQATGEVVWKNLDYPVSYPSPILINFAGQEQLVLLMEREIMGADPRTGQLIWHHAFTPPGANIATPVWDGESRLFFSSAYDSGSRVIKLTHEDGGTVPEELWYSRKLRIHHGNAIRLGDTIYASSGDFGPAFLMAMNLDTGKRCWIERGFGKSNFVYGDGKLIILDEDGQLALATVSPEGITIHAKCKIAERYAWAAPTLVGRTLYVRDRKHIMALDLG